MRTISILLSLAIIWQCSCSQQPEVNDVVVYGGTPAGVIAAVAAAREGANVVLIEQTSHIGGLNSSGLGTADKEGMGQGTISGLPLELYREIGRMYGKSEAMYHFEPKIFEQACLKMLDQYKIKIRYNLFVTKVKKDGKAIRAIQLDNGESINGNVFIDASYEGDLLARSGVSYTYGREGRAQYNESLAGIRFIDPPVNASPYDDEGRLLPGFVEKTDLVEGQGDKRVQSYNFRVLISSNPDRRPFPKPKHYNPDKYILLSRFLKEHPETGFKDKIVAFHSWEYPEGKFELNNINSNNNQTYISLGHIGGNVDYPDADYQKRKEIFEDHKSWTLGLLYFLANDPSVPDAIRKETNGYGLAADEFTDNENFPYYLYICEARRMIGSYVHTQHDILVNTSKVDAICLGSHFMDSHHVQRVAFSKTQFLNEGRMHERVPEAYEISYNTLVPKSDECTNLLVPVCLSASHVGFCSIRVEPTWMGLGEAAGTAAAMASLSRIPVQKIDVHSLQQKLTKQNAVVFRKDLQPQ